MSRGTAGTSLSTFATCLRESGSAQFRARPWRGHCCPCQAAGPQKLPSVLRPLDQQESEIASRLATKTTPRGGRARRTARLPPPDGPGAQLRAPPQASAEAPRSDASEATPPSARSLEQKNQLEGEVQAASGLDVGTGRTRYDQ
jgi:hypothetical protein